jgi:hypothetical protein
VSPYKVIEDGVIKGYERGTTQIEDSTGATINPDTIDPIVDTLLLSGAVIDSSSNSGNVDIKGARHVDVLIYVGAATGSPSITFYLDVIEPASGETIRSYSSDTLLAAGATWITVDNLLLGTTVRVRWTGTLDALNYFSGCYVRLVAKK